MSLDRSARGRASTHRAWLLGVWLCASCSDATAVVGKLGAPNAGRAATVRPLEDAGDGTRTDAGSGSGGRDASVTPPTRADTASSKDDIAPGPQIDDTPYRVSVETSSRDDVCNGTGPILVGRREGATTTSCAWRPERRVFGYGLCACEELRFESDTFVMDSYDSSQTAYKADQTGGSIGVNGAITRLAPDTRVLGSLISAGSAELALSGESLLVTGDFKHNAALRLNAGSVRVARDLWLGADVLPGAGPGKLQVDRDAYQAFGRSGLSRASVAGRVWSGDVRVPEPCDCGDIPVIDVRALVAQAKTDNDNAAAKLDPNALDLPRYATDFTTWPCGRLFLSRLTLPGINTYDMTFSSRTAIFVEGDLSVGSIATLVLRPEIGTRGELDLFIAGDVVVESMSSLVIGDASRPWATRVYVAGQMRITGALGLAGNLYAPQASLELSPAHADVDMYGSVFARKLRLHTQHMHYDRAIQHAAPSCSDTMPRTCDGCNQCPDGLACTSGICSACTRDADCCEPAVCSNGKCQALVSTWP